MSTETAPSLDIASPIAAFTEDQVARVTGLSKDRLRYWAKTGFFEPSYSAGPRRACRRFYSFRDVVALRTLELLRVKSNVTLQHLRKVAARLSHLRSDLWVGTRLFVVNRQVHFVNPETNKAEAVLTGQYVLEIPLGEVIERTGAEIVAFSRRRPESMGRIARDRAIANNAWVVAGTRIPVDAITRLLEDGYTPERIVEEYPELTRADVDAAIRHVETRAA